MLTAKLCIASGFLCLMFFTIYRFLLLYLRDVAPSKKRWGANCGVGKQLESRRAHVHGTLFAPQNIVAGLALAGLLMHLRIVFGAATVIMLAGCASIRVAMGWLAVASWQMEPSL